MCGIAGVISANLSRDELESVLRGFERDLHHRGPDDHGAYISRDGSVGLVNTRLSILDLSPAGHQPMHSRDDRYTIVYNGEVYNFAQLRSDLLAEGVSFRSNADTEVILAMYERFGPDCVREFEGMFAFAIWDEVEKSCFLARDPLGIKPLYYCESNGRLIFASELRALIDSGLVEKRLCSAGVEGYFLFGAVPEPLTLIDGVFALPAGNYLYWRNGRSELAKFSDVQFSNDPVSSEEAIRITRTALEESVCRHLVSDVPIGVFLSGGIDSTAIVALASQHSERPLRTFSIAFADPKFNEGDLAARTARHFGTEHTNWLLDSSTAKGLLEQFLAKSDQPSIDGFNTFCIAKLARDHGLTVVLSGLGGDELFGGYQSFSKMPQMVKASRALNPAWPLRSAGGSALERLGSPRVQRIGRFLRDLPTMAAAYWAMRGIFTPRETDQLLAHYGLTTNGSDGRSEADLQFYVPAQPTLEDEVSYLEITRYMRNQLLRDSDVMSMAWGLELRVPFVDSKLIAAVSRIPAGLRLTPGKRILVDAVPEIPEWVRNRPKQGFTFPFKDWVTTEWRDVFDRIDGNSPVPLKNWYRTWCLFALENFIEKNRVAVLRS